MSGPDLSVGRGVIAEVARLSALEIPEVLRVARGGPPWRVALAGARLSANDIDRVLLVGGPTQMPSVRAALVWSGLSCDLRLYLNFG